MDEGRLYEVLDYILNEATSRELDVIRGALERRADGGSGKGPMGVDLGKMAQESADSVKRSLDLSKGQMGDMVKGMVTDLIRKSAPELDDEQVQELLDEWVPDRSVRRGNRKESPSSPLPPDALLAMIKQFISYSTGTMSASEQMSLTRDIPGWKERYWQAFPPVIRKLLSMFLKGTIDGSTFWKGISVELGLEGG